MSTRDVRVGLVGCGEIAQLVHLRLLPRIPGVSVIALNGGSPRSLALASRLVPAATRFESLSVMLEEAPLDAVVVTAPTHAHADIACAVLESGRHLYLESPLADDFGRGCRIVDVWKRSRRVGMIGLPMHFHPLLLDLKRRLDSGEAGAPKVARLVFSTLPNLHADWTRDPERGGGVLLHKASHEIAAAQFLFGDVAKVSCQAPAGESRPESIALQLEFEKGPIAQIVATTGSSEDRRIEVYGGKGKLCFGWYDSLRVSFQPSRADGITGRMSRGLRELAGIPYLVSKLKAPINDPSFAPALEHFFAAIRSGTDARPSLSEGLKCLAVIEAAGRSLAEGRTVSPRVVETA